MSVVGNTLVLDCKKLIIYTLNEDGTITINSKLKILWTAFQLPREFKPPLLACMDYAKGINRYSLPPDNFTSFTGALDVVSGFVFFSRPIPIQENTPIINEGIALQPYYVGVGRRLTFRFTYSGSSNITEVELYYLRPSTGYLELAVDLNSNLTRYLGSSGTIDIFINSMCYYYFKVTTSDTNPFTLNLSVECLPPPKPDCDVPSKECLNIKSDGKKYSIPLLLNVSDGFGGYTVTPLQEWTAVADLIESTFITTRLPIPLTPIPPTINNSKVSDNTTINIAGPEYTLVIDGSNATPAQTFIDMITFGGLNFLEPSYTLWSQANVTSNGTASSSPVFVPLLKHNIDGTSIRAPASPGYEADNDIYYSFQTVFKTESGNVQVISPVSNFTLQVTIEVTNTDVAQEADVTLYYTMSDTEHTWYTTSTINNIPVSTTVTKTFNLSGPAFNNCNGVMLNAYSATFSTSFGDVTPLITARYMMTFSYDV